MHPKDADGMANSIDPDQTASPEAVCSWSALFAETYLSQYIEFVRYKYNLNSQKKNQFALSLLPPTFVEFTLYCHLGLKSKYTTHHSTMPLLY